MDEIEHCKEENDEDYNQEEQQKVVLFLLDNNCVNEEQTHPKSPMLSQARTHWRYWVVFGSFLTLMLEVASVLTLGVYLVPLREEFGTSAALTGWLASSAAALMGFSCLLGGLVVKKFGCRRTAIIGGIMMTIGFISSAFASSIHILFLTLSLITGVGAGITHIPAAVIIEEYFTTSYTFANGLAHVGIGVGLVMYPPLVEKLIDMFGWRGAFLIEGAIVFHIVATSCLFRPLEQRYTTTSSKTLTRERLSTSNPECNVKGRLSAMEEHDEDNELSLETKKMKTARASAKIVDNVAIYIPTIPIILVSLLLILASVGYLAVLAHGVATAIETGVSDTEASLVLSIMGASSILSRITHGWCIDHGYISALRTELVMLILATVVSYIYLLIEGFVMLMVFATCLGFATGVIFTLIPVIVRQIDTKERFAYNIGLVFGVGAFGDLCGGYFAGLIRDVTGSYYSAFYFSGSAFAFAAVINIILYAHQKHTTCRHP